MDKLKIIGGIPLTGAIPISGAKNAALPLMAASILTQHPFTLENVPNLADIQSLLNLLASLGITCAYDAEKKHLFLQGQTKLETRADYELVRKMRASILVLGPLVATQKKAAVSLPGGCAIGMRPVDLHLKALEALGAKILLKDGYIYAEAPHGLKGADIAFPVVSVTGTENILMAATLANGVTRIFNAAKEPEVTDLGNCLIKMGAQIQGLGTDVLTITGVPELGGAHHTVVADRIEMGTYIMASLITKGEIEIQQASLDLLPTVRTLLEDAGAFFKPTPSGFIVCKPHALKPLTVSTAPYPGFPTDLQAQLTSLLCYADGTSSVTETIFESRFMHVAELIRMGASIQIHGSTATIEGTHKKYLKGAPVMATDLRASASLVLAGLAAQGETIINRIYHLDRGYDALDKKLKDCGAHIERLP